MAKVKDPRYPGRCPACNANNLKRRTTSRVIYCYTCGQAGFSQEEVAQYNAVPRPVNEKRSRITRAYAAIRRARRSGVIAGPITIGRGMRWGDRV